MEDGSMTDRLDVPEFEPVSEDNDILLKTFNETYETLSELWNVPCPLYVNTN